MQDFICIGIDSVPKSGALAHPLRTAPRPEDSVQSKLLAIDSNRGIVERNVIRTGIICWL